MSRRVVVVGGGLAGLAASVYLARGGCAVTLFERRRQLGGRAMTHLRHGYRFNIGPHAVNRSGPAARAYRELGVTLQGGVLGLPQLLLGREREARFPGSLLSWLTTPFLNAAAKAEALRLRLRLGRIKAATVPECSVAEWLDDNVSAPALRKLVESLVALATFSSDPRQNARLAVMQLSASLRGQVIIDDGWQRLVDALHNQAVSAGVSFVTSSRIVRIVHDGAVRGLELGELEDAGISGTASLNHVSAVPFEPRGTMLPADHVVLAVDPLTASFLVGDGVGEGWKPAGQVLASCLDVALRSLPRPEAARALSADDGLSVSAHSEAGHLAPSDGAVVHVVKWGGGTEAELEQGLDAAQPGWRDKVVHRRFLPAMTVTNSFVAAGQTRPAVTTPVRNLYLAGDWVGDEGLLSDAALSSARQAARTILASS